MNDYSKKRDPKKQAIRVICLILAISMVISTVYLLYAYLLNAFS